jgi:hypothetical protein
VRGSLAARRPGDFGARKHIHRGAMERRDHDERSWAKKLRRCHRGGEPSNAASPMHGWFHGGDGKVEGVKSGLCAVGIGPRHDDDGS